MLNYYSIENYLKKTKVCLGSHRKLLLEKKCIEISLKKKVYIENIFESRNSTLKAYQEKVIEEAYKSITNAKKKEKKCRKNVKKIKSAGMNNLFSINNLK